MSKEISSPPNKRQKAATGNQKCKWGVKRTSAYLALGRPWAAVSRYWEGVVGGEHCLEALVLSAVGGTTPVLVPEEPHRVFEGNDDDDDKHARHHREAIQDVAGWRPQRTFRVTVAYLGLAYGGWAWQPAPGHRSVQGQLQLALAAVCEGRRPRLACSGRTDAGVNAVGQVFSFYTLDQTVEPTSVKRVITEAVAAVSGGTINASAAGTGEVESDSDSLHSQQSRIVRPASESRRARKAALKAARRTKQQTQQPGSAAAVASCRGPTLRVVSCDRAEDGFHATSAARWRRYVYVLPRRQTTTAIGVEEIRGEVAQCPDIDAESINALLQPLVQAGPLDFTAFARSNGRQTGEASVCHLLRCRTGTAALPCGTEVIVIEVVGTRFLRQMVRVLVATAVREAAKRAEKEIMSNPTTSNADSGAVAAADLGDSSDELLRYARLPSVRPALSISEIRAATASPAPAIGLCFASVGY